MLARGINAPDQTGVGHNRHSLYDAIVGAEINRQHVTLEGRRFTNHAGGDELPLRVWCNPKQPAQFQIFDFRSPKLSDLCREFNRLCFEFLVLMLQRDWIGNPGVGRLNRPNKPGRKGTQRHDIRRSRDSNQSERRGDEERERYVFFKCDEDVEKTTHVLGPGFGENLAIFMIG